MAAAVRNDSDKPDRNNGVHNAERTGGKRSASEVGRKVMINSLVGMGAVGIYFISRLALTPFILHYVTLAEFGLWAMCFVILAYAGLGALGVNNAYVKFTAEYHAQNDTQAISSLLSTGIFCMTIFCLVFYFVLYLILPFILEKFHVSTNLRDIAAFMILGTAIAFCFDFTLGGFPSALNGLQEMALTKTINVGASLFEVVLIVIFLPLGFGIKGLLYAYIIKTVAEMFICMVIVHRKLPDLRLSPRRISQDAFRTLFVFGGKVQVLGGISIFLASLDRLVISWLDGLSATGLFEVGRKFPFTGRNISRAAFAPLFPAASHIGGEWERWDKVPATERISKYVSLAMVSLAIAALPGIAWLWSNRLVVMHMEKSYVVAGIAILVVLLPTVFLVGRRLYGNLVSEDRLQAGDLRNLYLKSFRHVNLVNVTIFSFLMAAARPILISWVGPKYLAATAVMVLLSLANMIHQGTGPASLMVRGINRVGRELEYLIIQLVLAVLWIPAGTHLWGITGTALGILASAAVASMYFFWRTNYAFRVDFREFARLVLKPAVAPGLSALLVYLLTLLVPGNNRITAAVTVLGLGMFHLILTFSILHKWVLIPEERAMVSSLLARFKPARRNV